MTRLILVASLCLGVFASGAGAANLSIKSRLSETAEVSDNYFLGTAPSGVTVRSYSVLSVDMAALTRTARYGLSGDFSYYRYFGPGADDTSLKSGTGNSLTFSVDRPGKLGDNSYKFSASWQRSDVATTLLEQTGRASATGDVNTYSAQGSVTRQLTRRDSITWSARVGTADFPSSGGSGYVDMASTITWSRRLSQLTSVTTSVDVDWFMQDDAAQTERLFWKIVTGLQTRLSKRLTFSGNVGINFMNAYQNAVVQPVVPASTMVQQPGAATGWLASAGLSYHLFRNTQVSLTASHSTSPTILGELQTSDSIGLSFGHTINTFSSLSAAGQFSRSTSGGFSGGGETDFLTVSVIYAYRLAREWQSQLSYTYRQRDDSFGLVTSNTVLVSVSRDATLLP